MSRWFRMYERVIDDPKVQMLPAEDFRAWVNLLCLSSRNKGRLPSVREIAFALRMDANDVVTLLERLLNATLIDRRSGGEDGVHYAPHNWSELQYKSDTSTDRVKRFRERSKTVSETPPETDTETDTESSGAKAPSRSRATGLPSGDNEHVFRVWCVQWAVSDMGWSAGDAGREYERFTDHAIAKGRTAKDWKAAWRGWCRNQFQKTKPAEESAHSPFRYCDGPAPKFVPGPEPQTPKLVR